MVFLKSVAFSGLYSYDSESPHVIDLSSLNVVVGPNDSGKSNLFRIIRLLGEILTTGNRKIQDSEVFSSGPPKVQIRATLTDEEADTLLDFLSFYRHRINPGGGEVMRAHEFKNRRKLLPLVNEVEIAESWTVGSFEAWDPSFSLGFSKLGITATSIGSSGIATVKETETMRSATAAAEAPFPVFLDTVSKEVDPKALFKRAFDIPPLSTQPPFQIQEVQGQLPSSASDFERASLRRLMLQFGLQPGFGNISLGYLIGSLLTRKMFISTGGSIFYRSALESERAIFPNLQPAAEQPSKGPTGIGGSLLFAKQLDADGWNLARFLYSLKSSESASDRRRYAAIQGKFGSLFQTTAFDVAMRYSNENFQNFFPQTDHQTPLYPYIVINDNRTSKQFPLDKVGAGLAESLFLLTASSGVENPILLLDEPAVNLHPSHMKALAKSLAQSGSQLIIITHSPELVHQEIFELGASIIHVRRGATGSSLRRMDMGVAIANDERYKLSYQIDTRIFFAKHVILSEGEADEEFLEIVSRHYRAEIDTNQDLIVNVKSNGNFRKYADILRAFEIPFVILGDTDGLEGEQLNNRATSFAGEATEFCTVTKDGLRGSENARLFFLEGDLEKFMTSLDPEIYEKSEREVKAKEGRVKKPLVAHEFAIRAIEENPHIFSASVKPFLEAGLQRPLS